MSGYSPSRPMLRGTRAKTTERKTVKGQRELDRRAVWIMREWERTPTLSYAECIDLIRERFECGHSAAEQAYARANEMWQSAALEIDPNRLLSFYWKLAEHALSDPKPARGAIAAAKIVDSIFEKTGLAAPHKMEHSFADVQRMGHLGVLGMTPTQRAQREAELLAVAEQRRMAAAAKLEATPSAERVIDATATESRETVSSVVEREFAEPLSGDDEETEIDGTDE